MKNKFFTNLKNLDVNLPIETQKNALDWFNRNDCYNLVDLIMPCNSKYQVDKSHWENAAKVISSKDDYQLESILPVLYEWLKDMNWPGAWIILDRLNELPFELRKNNKKIAINKAKKEKDLMWLEALSYID